MNVCIVCSWNRGTKLRKEKLMDKSFEVVNIFKRVNWGNIERCWLSINDKNCESTSEAAKLQSASTSITRGLWLHAITRVLSSGIEINKPFPKVALMTKIILSGRCWARVPWTTNTRDFYVTKYLDRRTHLSDCLTLCKQWLPVNLIKTVNI